MPDQPIALVLAGGGARGAYEAGVLSVLLPALPADQRPNLIVGSSVGAINGAYVAATLPDGDDPPAAGRAIWEQISWGDVLATPSLRDLERIVRGALNFTGLLSLDIPALLDATPLEHDARAAIPFERIAEHVDAGRLLAAAVVATSAHTGRSVVFHRAARRTRARRQARIDYVPTMLDEQHVRASSAIPALFPAVEIEDGRPRLVLRRRHAHERADQARAVARRRARDRGRPELDRARARAASPGPSARTSSPAPPRSSTRCSPIRWSRTSRR